jgi:hypothetical protein
MVAFLFWNLNRKPLSSTVAQLALEWDVDVVLLAECRIAPAVMLTALNVAEEAPFRYAPGYGCRKVKVFTRFPRECIRPSFETRRLTIRHVTLPGMRDILLCVIHFPSKLHCRDSSQALECVALADQIRSEEHRIGHARTVLVGDLNMNPFEDGVTGAKGLHGVMTRRLAQRGSRTVLGNDYPFFFNPMWGLLGDRPDSPPGSYYRRGSEHVELFWHMFDQVLLRPELLSSFDAGSLRILQSDGCTSLLGADGAPNNKNFSDHLPLYFKLDL